MRHRLNRGGDRAFNSAIHTVAMVRMRRSWRRGSAYGVGEYKGRPAGDLAVAGGLVGVEHLADVAVQRIEARRAAATVARAGQQT